MQNLIVSSRLKLQFIKWKCVILKKICFWTKAFHFKRTFFVCSDISLFLIWLNDNCKNFVCVFLFLPNFKTLLIQITEIWWISYKFTTRRSQIRDDRNWPPNIFCHWSMMVGLRPILVKSLKGDWYRKYNIQYKLSEQQINPKVLSVSCSCDYNDNSKNGRNLSQTNAHPSRPTPTNSHQRAKIRMQISCCIM